jgi:signal transduction histidine kinase
MSIAEGWQATTQIALNGALLSPAAETAIFRIAQEALANARKHAHTRAIRVALTSDTAALALHVQDWGRGFDLSGLHDERTHLGLVSMRERANMLGGECEIVSQPGAGTTVAVSMPLVALKALSPVNSQGYG